MEAPISGRNRLFRPEFGSAKVELFLKNGKAGEEFPEILWSKSGCVLLKCKFNAHRNAFPKAAPFNHSTQLRFNRTCHRELRRAKPFTT
jgi:hypothetical protein